VEGIIDGPEVELSSDDQLAEVTTDFNLAEISEEGKGLDFSVDIGRDIYIQSHAETVPGTKDIQTLSTARSGEQVPHNGYGVDLMIFPIALLFYKIMMNAFEKHGKSSSRLHARQWRKIMT
jgi:hypothetical protein